MTPREARDLQGYQPPLIIGGHPGTGKTWHIAHELDKDPLTIAIVPHRAAARALLRIPWEGGPPATKDRHRRVFTWEEVVNGHRLEGLSYDYAYIDDLELCLAHHLGRIKLAGVSLTGHPVVLQHVKPDDLGG